MHTFNIDPSWNDGNIIDAIARVSTIVNGGIFVENTSSNSYRIDEANNWWLSHEGNTFRLTNRYRPNGHPVITAVCVVAIDVLGLEKFNPPMI